MSHTAEMVLHLGYPRTGTTTLQCHVFPDHPDIDYIGKFIPSLRYREEWIFPQVDALYRSSQLRSIDVDRTRDYIQKVRRESSRKVVILSSESFLHPTAVDVGLVIQRINSVFAPCKILLTIREQLDILRSFYSMYGQFGQYFYVDALYDHERLEYPIGFDAWIELQKRAPDKNLLGTLRYSEVVSSLRSYFGPDNVHVSLYEELVSDPPSYARKLSRAIGICEDKTIELLGDNKVNSSQKPSFRHRIFCRNRKLEPSPEQVTFVEDYYREGNKALCDVLGLPLASFGYKT